MDQAPSEDDLVEAVALLLLAKQRLKWYGTAADAAIAKQIDALLVRPAIADVVDRTCRRQAQEHDARR